MQKTLSPLLHPTNASWYHALTLSERAALSQSSPGVNSIDEKQSARYIQQWRTQKPFEEEDYFAQRLALQQMTEETFYSLLGESPEQIQSRLSTPPEWLDTLISAYSYAQAHPDSCLHPPAIPGRAQEAIGFFYLVEPIVRFGARSLRRKIGRLIERRGLSSSALVDPDAVINFLLTTLPAQLMPMISRVAVLELNVARLRGQLDGETAEERYLSFVDHIKVPNNALEILKEYPVVARLVSQAIRNWVDVSLELLQRLCDDQADIEQRLNNGAALGTLTGIEGGVGDTHRGGRSVNVLHFDTTFSIVYKPHSLAVDIHFQALLDWLNERGTHPPFRTLTILDRDEYGWVEFVQAHPCQQEEEVKRFYQRQGAYLALLYALEATDFHFENLIASGEHPVLIDLESLFHPRAGGDEVEAGYSQAGREFVYSVLRVGLLPQRFWSSDEYVGIDMSGLGAVEGQLTPHRVPLWERGGTDQMHFIRKRVPIPGGKNRPALADRPLNALDYASEIEQGFIQMYRLLLRERESLLAPGGQLARFADSEVRVILRPTRTYSLLHYEGFHPDFLRCGLARARFLDRLWVGVTQQPYLQQIVAAEHDDLTNGDIPMFTTRPGSHDLWTSRGERIPGFFDTTGLELVRRRLQRFSATDLERQRWFIEASLATLSAGIGQSEWPEYELTTPQRPVSTDRLLEAAAAIGDRLEVLALRGTEGDDVNWIGLTLFQERHWQLVPLGFDLYSGLAGVILFLAYLGEVTQSPGYTTLARRGLSRFQQQAQQAESLSHVIGGFNGWGGVIYLYTHLASLWGDTTFRDEALRLTQMIQPHLAKDDQLDVIGGVAGCVGGLASLYRLAPSASVRDALRKCGERLLVAAQPTGPNAVNWPTPMEASQPLVGFSHGASGIAWSLLKVAELLGESRYREAAVQGMRYERSCFSEERQNWPDFRLMERDGQVSHGEFMLAWCHGAPGVGLARVYALTQLEDHEAYSLVEDDLERALSATLAGGFGGNHSLCHGDLGNLELLVQVARHHDPSLTREVERLSAIILDSIDEHGWLCGIPLGVESPGLMMGLAGIGYGLLHLAAPDVVPSILLMEAPLVSQGGS